MKTALALVFTLLPALAFAQNNNQTPLAHAMSSCGPLDVRFDAQASAAQATAQAQPGKALVYVVEEFRKPPGEWGNPTIRVGLDGAWMGAVRPSSYVSFTVDPGEHHLCSSWQSRFQRLSKLAAFAGFTAEADKVYYFRAHVTYSTTSDMDLHLEPVNPDEGQYLVASYEPSASHAKK